MSNELFSLKGITIKDLNTGLILINESVKVEYLSDLIKNWFGSSIKEGFLLPQEFRPSSPFSIVQYNDSEYICLNFNIRSENIIYQLLLLFEAKTFIEHFPQQMLYNICQDEIKSILDCVTDGVYVTDKVGNTLLLNKAAAKSWSLPSDQLIGKNMKDLFKILYPDLSDEEIKKKSVCLSVIEHKKAVSMIQSGENDKFKVLVTGTPHFEGGEIAKVISTERNVSELLELHKQLDEKIEIATKYEAELEHYRALSTVDANIIIEDKKMKSLFQLAFKIAKQDTTVILQGESGTGKEVFARFIHNNSLRSSMPFIDINCAAIPENLLESELFGYEKGAFTGASDKGKIGMFELADKGSLFLDEIGELPLHLQSKILRAVQEKKIQRIGGNKTISIDVRIISATNKNLKDAVENKLFREDLYYRLNVVKLVIPPLRDRNSDIQLLISHYLSILNRKNNTDIKISSDALNLLYNYEWPGNIRELSNVIEAAYVTCESDKITSDQLTDIFPDMLKNIKIPSPYENTNLKDEIELYEKKLILSMMPLFQSSQALADYFKIDKSTLIRKMNRYGIKNTYILK